MSTPHCRLGPTLDHIQKAMTVASVTAESKFAVSL